MIEALKAELAKRNWWMNLMYGFCLYMTFVYMPFDLFWKPVEQDVEIWFGFALHGWAAKATEPLHWLIYGAGAYGFWKMRSWMWPWAAAYVLQVAIAMAVFGYRQSDGEGWIAALIAGAIFMIPTIALWRARDAFGNGASEAPTATN